MKQLIVAWAVAMMLAALLFLTNVALYQQHQQQPILKQQQQQQKLRKVAIAFESGTADAEKTRSVLQVFMDVLPRDWRFQVFVTSGSRFVFETAPGLADVIASGRVELTVVPRFNRTTYMRWQLDPAFWESVHGDWVLLFHADSVPCRGSNHTAEEWLGTYDYLGAPWLGPDHASWADDKGGNSGLSVRNRTAMLVLLRERADDVAEWLRRHPDGWGEDVFIGRYGPSAGMRIAPQDVEQTFSVEMAFYPRPFGIHKPWNYLTLAQTQELLQNCPDARIICPPWLLHWSGPLPSSYR